MSSKKLHCLRLSYENWENDQRFTEVLNLLDKYRDCFDEISLLSSSTHAPLTILENKRRITIMQSRLTTLRSHGFNAGVNWLTTIGHHEEDLDNSFKGDYFQMTNLYGETCKGSFCMSDERYLNDYIRPLYSDIASISPDHIWIDDDIRLGHLPVGMCCFCQNCIQKFNQKNGYSFNRETLVKALNDGDINLRKAWLNHNGKTICNLLKTIADTIYSINPTITLGFMTGERYLESYQFADFANALSDGGKHQISWRPGGGAYTDYNFSEIITKSEEIGRQTAFLPPFVSVIQSELESFPYQLIKKTPTSTALESAWAMASGCTGTAFNIMPGESLEPVTTIEKHFSILQKTLPFYRILSQKIGGKQPVGIHTGWRTYSQASAPVGSFAEYPTGYHVSFAHEFFDFGLPQCFNPDNARITLLKGQLLSCLTDQEIIKLLSGGIYMDASALKVLNERGFGHLTGFKVEKEVNKDATEKYLSHPLNLGFENCKRNSRQAFNPGDSFSLVKTHKDAQTLASLVDYHDNILADCCLGIFENSLGGRICVSGYYPFTWVSDFNKTTLLKRITTYLSKSTIPSFVESYCRIRNHSFIVDGKTFVALCNPTNERLERIEVKVRTNKDNGVYYTQDGVSHQIKGLKNQKGEEYLSFCIERLAPYQMVLLEI